MADNSLKIKKSLSFTPQATPPANPQIGDIYLDSTQNKLLQYNGSTWVQTGNDLLDVLLQQNFNLASLTDFTQTGLELITNPTIQGAKSARLIHQAATTYSFQETKSVDRKYRGKNNTLSMIARSSASSANVTLEVTGTNGVTTTTLLSSTFTTGQITASVFNTTSGLPTVTVTDNAILNRIIAGATITGSGIPTGTTVLSVGSSSITLSANATATATGVGLKVSSLPKSQNFSFEIPADYNSITYKVSALAEAGLPETYVDDIVIELTEMAMTSTSVATTTKNGEIVGSAYNELVGPLTITGTIPADGTVPQSTEGSLILSTSYAPKRVGNKLRFTVNGYISEPANTGNSLTFALFKDSDTSAFAVGSTNNVPAANSQNTGLITIVKELTVSSLASISINLRAGNDGGNATINELRDDATGNNFGNTLATSITIEEVQVSDYTETQTIPLSSSVIVTEPDSYLHLSNGTVSGAGNFSFSNISKSVGDAFSANPSTGTITVLKEGLYNISFYCSRTSGLVGAYVLANGVPVIADYGQDVNETYSGSAEVYLQPGNTIVVQNPSTGVSSTGNLFVSFTGKTKILNPSSDQKVEIPTHELRFEGASSRGSVATAIVKFDTLAKIKGDGFEVINTAADGTYVRIKKAGRLIVNANVYLNGSADLAISKNQAVLTAMPVGSEIEAWIGVSPSRANLPATIDVVPNDIIRIASTLTPTAISSNILSLKLQEQSVAVALQNVAPRWDDSDSAVRVQGGNGFGSTNTAIRRYSSVLENLGTAVEYVGSATLGDSFLIKETGLYSVSATDAATTASSFFITKNSLVNSPTTNIALETMASSGIANASVEVYLQKGDIIRFVAENPANMVSAYTNSQFSITKVGKTQGTVDVTPFVQIPQSEDVSVRTNGNPQTTYTANTPIVFTGVVEDVYKLYNTSTGQFTSPITGNVNVCYYINTNAATNTATYIYVNGVQRVASGQSYSAAGLLVGSATVKVLKGDLVDVRSSNPWTVVAGGNSVTFSFELPSPSIATPTEQVSSDTIPFVFKATAITDSDPVGTFNTYTYAAGTNTATISAAAPTQSTSSMNINGVQVFARAYNVTSTAAQPTRVDIKIGRGLKSVQLDAYGVSSKSTPIGFNRSFTGNAGEEVGANYFYNETTGVLTIDAGLAFSGSNVVRTIDSNRTHSNGYFVFNASKSPSLVSIPNLQQRVAYLSDVKSSGTGGGSSIVGTQTRTLNTLVDNTGIVSSLASNQFTLSAGTYQIEASAPAYKTLQHKTRLRNMTDSTTAIFGSSEYADNTYNVCNRSFLSGEITITSSKTFEIQHYTSRVETTNGIGVATSTGEVEVYTQVKITKIK